jgi:predicted porin
LFVPGAVGTYDPSVRDVNSHYLYAGADYTFNPQLQGYVKIGVMLNDFPDADEVEDVFGNGLWDTSSTTPWADARLTWTYNPGSYLMVGVVHTLNTTDVSAQNQESTAVFASLNHRITPKLTGSLRGHFQYSAYNGGFYDGEADLLYAADVNLSYAFNVNLSAEAGYTFDRLDSDLSYAPGTSRSYSRNRFYLGLRAAY